VVQPYRLLFMAWKTYLPTQQCWDTDHHHTHNRLTALFPGPPRWASARENFQTLWCKGRLTEADTETIRLGATPSGLTSAHYHHPQETQSTDLTQGLAWRHPLCAQSHTRLKGYSSFHAGCPTSAPEILQNPLLIHRLTTLLLLWT